MEKPEGPGVDPGVRELIDKKSEMGKLAEETPIGHDGDKLAPEESPLTPEQTEMAKKAIDDLYKTNEAKRHAEADSNWKQNAQVLEYDRCEELVRSSSSILDGIKQANRDTEKLNKKLADVEEEYKKAGSLSFFHKKTLKSESLDLQSKIEKNNMNISDLKNKLPEDLKNAQEFIATHRRDELLSKASGDE